MGLFVLLVGTICSMTTKSKLSPFEENLLPEHSIMKRLNNIFVQLKDITDSSSNVKTYNAFTMVIQGLIDDLNKDTKKHFEVLEQMTKKCTAEDEFRDKEVADAKTAIHNAGASRKVCQEHLNKAKTLLAEAKNLLAAEIQKKKERTEIRAKEHAIFVNEKRTIRPSYCLHERIHPNGCRQIRRKPSCSFIHPILRRIIEKNLKNRKSWSCRPRPHHDEPICRRR